MNGDLTNVASGSGERERERRRQSLFCDPYLDVLIRSTLKLKSVSDCWYSIDRWKSRLDAASVSLHLLKRWGQIYWSSVKQIKWLRLTAANKSLHRSKLRSGKDFISPGFNPIRTPSSDKSDWNISKYQLNFKPFPTALLLDWIRLLLSIPLARAFSFIGSRQTDQNCQSSTRFRTSYQVLYAGNKQRYGSRQFLR